MKTFGIVIYRVALVASILLVSITLRQVATRLAHLTVYSPHYFISDDPSGK